MAPFIVNAIKLLIAAPIIVLVAGIVMRLFVFRRDADDIRNKRD